MAEHVDLVKNEWTAGMQVRLAAVVHTDSGVGLAFVTPGWEDLLKRPIVDSAGHETSCSEEPDAWYGALPEFYKSGYVFATESHDEAVCPFRHGPVLSMRSTLGKHTDGGLTPLSTQQQ